MSGYGDPIDPALVEAIRSTTEEGAALAMQSWRTPLAVRNKGSVDLVTDIDVEIEVVLRDRLRRLLPSAAFIGEELPHEATGALSFYVDPIDGTSNYAHGHPFFAVSVALVADGFPIIAALAAPALRTTWTAALGRGATRNGVPCRVSSTSTIDRAFCATGFPYDRRTNPDANFVEFEHMKRRVLGVRRCGSAALDLAMIADGTYDVYWERSLKPWDIAAGLLLVREAGGTTTDYAGAPVTLDRGEVVATNGALQAATLEVLGNARNGAR